MPFDVSEGLAAGFRALPIFQDVSAKVAALPPAETRKASDYGPILGVLPGGSLALVLAEVNDPVHKAVDLIPILGLDAKGDLGLFLALVDQVIEDVKD